VGASDNEKKKLLVGMVMDRNSWIPPNQWKSSGP
jgi:hypothetical protein